MKDVTPESIEYIRRVMRTLEAADAPYHVIATAHQMFWVGYAMAAEGLGEPAIADVALARASVTTEVLP